MFTFLYPIGYQRAQFFQELCIMRAAAENSFTRVLNPHIFIFGQSFNAVLFDNNVTLKALLSLGHISKSNNAYECRYEHVYMNMYVYWRSTPGGKRMCSGVRVGVRSVYVYIHMNVYVMYYQSIALQIDDKIERKGFLHGDEMVSFLLFLLFFNVFVASTIKGQQSRILF